jgi:magnesium-protoporphyrin IX monomethyl ester (oxidative) cyclase
MKILLINPPNSVEEKIDFTINVFQPLGLAYIAAVLEKNNYQVKILDAMAEGFDQERVQKGRRRIGLDYFQIKKEIKKFEPDIVGVSTLFSLQANETHNIIDLVKKIDRNIITVVGGSHPTIQPESMLKNKNVDYVIRGEGEYVILEFVRAIEKNQSVNDIRSLSYRSNNDEVINNPRREVIKDLDNLPFPARHLLPMGRYFEAAKKVRVTEGLAAYGKRWTGIITSRGCPFMCTFCSVHLTMTRFWRARSPENVVNEIKDFVEKYGIQYFDILDDNLTLIPERTKEICKLLIESKLRIKWSTPNGIRADKVDEELIGLMKRAGCIRLKVAPESGNQEVLDKMIKKNLDLKKVKEVVALCKKHGLPVEAFFMVGFPEETESNIKDTIKYAKELRKRGCEYCYFFVATPYFGTEMYKDAVSKGYLDESKYHPDALFTTTGKSIMRNPRLLPKKLEELLKIANKINPVLTKSRLGVALYLLHSDPLRALKYVKNIFHH